MLGLGKSESRDFDGQIADTTITMIQYIFLALRNRIEKYESLGAVFEQVKVQTLELKLHERLIKLLIAITEILEDLFEDIDIEKLFVRLLNDERAFERLKPLLFFTETKTNLAA